MRPSTRVAWASEAARAAWAPRVAAIQAAWADVELAAVAAGARPAALVFGWDAVRRAKLPAVTVAPNRFAVGCEAEYVAQAYGDGDDKAVGELLGYPACCGDFFHNVWNVEKKRDPTPHMAGAPEAGACSVIWRWLGVRLVPHLPCSWTCSATRAFAERLTPFWPREAFADAAQILTWPALYSALHGVVIVTGPVVKVVTTTETDYTATNTTIRVPGYNYPAEAARGLGFPFERPATVHVLTTRPDPTR